MFSSLRSRLFLSYLAILLIGMGLAAVLAWLAVEQSYIATQRENLLTQVKLAAAGLEGAELPDEAAQPYAQTMNVMPGLHSRILSDSGAVVVGLPLADGEALIQAPAAENSGYTSSADLLQRLEIQSALQGEANTALRRVAAAGNRRVLYAAAPILAGDGSVEGILYLATPLPPGSLPARLVWQLAGALLAALLLAGAAGTFLARRLARPIETVARAAQAVSAGDLNQSVPGEDQISELGSLGQSFNKMTASLRQADQAKNAFVADVTHELRTPLTVIKGTIETLEDGALDDMEGRGPLLASMQRETERLIRLVGDLLTLTRYDAGMLKLDSRPLDFVKLAQERCAHFSTLAAPRQVKLHVENASAPADVMVLADADRLAQVLDNLLDNAIRHTAEGSTVAIAIRQAGGEVQCAVRDQGPGIPVEHLPFIFERFYRVDASRDRRTGGAGLGLSIARALVQAQGGSIQAHSAPGQGATITFYLSAGNTAIKLPEN